MFKKALVSRGQVGAGFTLLELSVVITVLALLGAAYIRYSTSQTDANNTVTLNATLDTIEIALMNYRTANNRLPCPAAIASAENVATFGTEVGTAGDGNCTGADYTNSTLDPDNTGGSDNNYSGGADLLYDYATLNQIVDGALPTKTLRLPDRYAYDPWGRKILYVVDKRITASSAFITYPANGSTAAGTVGGIVIKGIGTNNSLSTPSCSANTGNPASTSCLSAAITIKAIYALVSFGKNGHGGYVRNPSGTSTMFNASSLNNDELVNCHCSYTGAPQNLTRIFVQKALIPNTTIYGSGYTAGFDDVVRFKTRQDMNTIAEVQ